MDWWNLSLILVLVPQTTALIYVCQDRTETGQSVNLQGVIKSGEDDKIYCMCIVTSQYNNVYVYITSVTFPDGNEYKLKFSAKDYSTYYSSYNYANHDIYLPSSTDKLYINVVKGSYSYGGFKFDLQVYTSQGKVKVACMKNLPSTTTITTTPQPTTTTTTTTTPSIITTATTTTTPQPTKTEITTDSTRAETHTDQSMNAGTTGTKADNSSPIIIGSLVGVVVIMAGIIIFLLCIIKIRCFKSANKDLKEENRAAMTGSDNNMNSERAHTDGNTYETLTDNNEYETPQLYSPLGPQSDLEGLKTNSTQKTPPSTVTQESRDTVCVGVAELKAMNNLTEGQIM